jgi:hypothetical protein
LKLVEEIHTFHLNPTLCNFKVYSFTFIHLKLLTRSAKTVKTEVSLPNDVSLTFSSLSLNDTSFRVFNLGLKNFNWVYILLISSNFIHNCIQTFNFTQFQPCQTQLLAYKLTVFFVLVLDSAFMHFDP